MADDEFDALFSQFDCDKCIAELNDPKQDSTTSESLPLQPSVIPSKYLKPSWCIYQYFWGQHILL